MKGGYRVNESGIHVAFPDGGEGSVDWSEVEAVHVSQLALPEAAAITYLNIDTTWGSSLECDDQTEGFNRVLEEIGKRLSIPDTKMEQVQELTPESDILTLYRRAAI